MIKTVFIRRDVLPRAEALKAAERELSLDYNSVRLVASGVRDAGLWWADFNVTLKLRTRERTPIRHNVKSAGARFPRRKERRSVFRRVFKEQKRKNERSP